MFKFCLFVEANQDSPSNFRNMSIALVRKTLVRRHWTIRSSNLKFFRLESPRLARNQWKSSFTIRKFLEAFGSGESESETFSLRTPIAQLGT